MVSCSLLSQRPFMWELSRWLSWALYSQLVKILVTRKWVQHFSAIRYMWMQKLCQSCISTINIYNQYPLRRQYVLEVSTTQRDFKKLFNGEKDWQEFIFNINFWLCSLCPCEIENQHHVHSCPLCHLSEACVLSWVIVSPNFFHRTWHIPPAVPAHFMC